MSERIHLLAFAGSAREASFNKRLLQVAGAAAERAGADVTYVDFKTLPLPLYDQEEEERSGFPENVIRFKDMMKASDGFLIAAPEHNGSITAMLKNAIDWASRADEGEKPLECFRDKFAVLMSASPGGLGGLRGLIPLRTLLSGIGTHVLADQVAVPKAHEEFDDNGQLKDEKHKVPIEKLAEKLVKVLKRVKGS